MDNLNDEMNAGNGIPPITDNTQQGNHYDFAAAISDNVSLGDINQQVKNQNTIPILIPKGQYIEEHHLDPNVGAAFYDNTIVPKYKEFQENKFNEYDTAKPYLPDTAMFRAQGMPTHKGKIYFDTPEGGQYNYLGDVKVHDISEQRERESKGFIYTKDNKKIPIDMYDPNSMNYLAADTVNGENVWKELESNMAISGKELRPSGGRVSDIFTDESGIQRMPGLLWHGVVSGMDWTIGGLQQIAQIVQNHIPGLPNVQDVDKDTEVQNWLQDKPDIRQRLNQNPELQNMSLDQLKAYRLNEKSPDPTLDRLIKFQDDISQYDTSTPWTSSAKYYGASLNEDEQSLGTIRGMFANVNVGLGKFAPMLLTAMTTKGIGMLTGPASAELVGTIGQEAGLLTIGLSTSAETTQQAKDWGLDADTATKLGGAMGIASYLSMKLVNPELLYKVGLKSYLGLVNKFVDEEAASWIEQAGVKTIQELPNEAKKKIFANAYAKVGSYISKFSDKMHQLTEWGQTQNGTGFMPALKSTLAQQLATGAEMIPVSIATKLLEEPIKSFYDFTQESTSKQTSKVYDGVNWQQDDEGQWHKLRPDGSDETVPEWQALSEMKDKKMSDDIVAGNRSIFGGRESFGQFILGTASMAFTGMAYGLPMHLISGGRQNIQDLAITKLVHTALEDPKMEQVILDHIDQAVTGKSWITKDGQVVTLPKSKVNQDELDSKRINLNTQHNDAVGELINKFNETARTLAEEGKYKDIEELDKKHTEAVQQLDEQHQQGLKAIENETNQSPDRISIDEANKTMLKEQFQLALSIARKYGYTADHVIANGYNVELTKQTFDAYQKLEKVNLASNELAETGKIETNTAEDIWNQKGIDNTTTEDELNNYKNKLNNYIADRTTLKTGSTYTRAYAKEWFKTVSIQTDINNIATALVTQKYNDQNKDDKSFDLQGKLSSDKSFKKDFDNDVQKQVKQIRFQHQDMQKLMQHIYGTEQYPDALALMNALNTMLFDRNDNSFLGKFIKSNNDRIAQSQQEGDDLLPSADKPGTLKNLQDDMQSLLEHTNGDLHDRLSNVIKKQQFGIRSNEIETKRTNEKQFNEVSRKVALENIDTNLPKREYNKQVKETKAKYDKQLTDIDTAHDKMLSDARFNDTISSHPDIEILNNVNRINPYIKSITKTLSDINLSPEHNRALNELRELQEGYKDSVSNLHQMIDDQIKENGKLDNPDLEDSNNTELESFRTHLDTLLNNSNADITVDNNPLQEIKSDVNYTPEQEAMLRRKALEGFLNAPIDSKINGYRAYFENIIKTADNPLGSSAELRKTLENLHLNLQALYSFAHLNKDVAQDGMTDKEQKGLSPLYGKTLERLSQDDMDYLNEQRKGNKDKDIKGLDELYEEAKLILDKPGRAANEKVNKILDIELSTGIIDSIVKDTKLQDKWKASKAYQDITNIIDQIKAVAGDKRNLQDIISSYKSSVDPDEIKENDELTEKLGLLSIELKNKIGQLNTKGELDTYIRTLKNKMTKDGNEYYLNRFESLLAFDNANPENSRYSLKHYNDPSQPKYADFMTLQFLNIYKDCGNIVNGRQRKSVKELYSIINDVQSERQLNEDESSKVVSYQQEQVLLQMLINRDRGKVDKWTVNNKTKEINNVCLDPNYADELGMEWSILVNGFAGTGKSTVLIQDYISCLHRMIQEKGVVPRDVKYTVLSPTTILLDTYKENDSNINHLSQYTGKTLDSINDLDVNQDVIIIDEYSALSKEQYLKIKQKLNGSKAQVIFIGDDGQISASHYPAATHSGEQTMLPLQDSYRSGDVKQTEVSNFFRALMVNNDDTTSYWLKHPLVGTWGENDGIKFGYRLVDPTKVGPGHNQVYKDFCEYYNTLDKKNESTDAKNIILILKDTKSVDDFKTYVKDAKLSSEQKENILANVKTAIYDENDSSSFVSGLKCKNTFVYIDYTDGLKWDNIEDRKYMSRLMQAPTSRTETGGFTEIYMGDIPSDMYELDKGQDKNITSLPTYGITEPDILIQRLDYIHYLDKIGSDGTKVSTDEDLSTSTVDYRQNLSLSLEQQNKLSNTSKFKTIKKKLQEGIKTYSDEGYDNKNDAEKAVARFYFYNQPVLTEGMNTDQATEINRRLTTARETYNKFLTGNGLEFNTGATFLHEELNNIISQPTVIPGIRVNIGTETKPEYHLIPFINVVGMTGEEDGNRLIVDVYRMSTFAGKPEEIAQSRIEETAKIAAKLISENSDKLVLGRTRMINIGNNTSLHYNVMHIVDVDPTQLLSFSKEANIENVKIAGPNDMFSVMQLKKGVEIPTHRVEELPRGIGQDRLKYKKGSHGEMLIPVEKVHMLDENGDIGEFYKLQQKDADLNTYEPLMTKEQYESMPDWFDKEHVYFVENSVFHKEKFTNSTTHQVVIHVNNTPTAMSEYLRSNVAKNPNPYYIEGDHSHFAKLQWAIMKSILPGTKITKMFYSNVDFGSNGETGDNTLRSRFAVLNRLDKSFITDSNFDKIYKEANEFAKQAGLKIKNDKESLYTFLDSNHLNVLSNDYLPEVNYKKNTGEYETMKPERIDEYFKAKNSKNVDKQNEILGDIKFDNNPDVDSKINEDNITMNKWRLDNLYKLSQNGKGTQHEIHEIRLGAGFELNKTDDINYVKVIGDNLNSKFGLEIETPEISLDNVSARKGYYLTFKFKDSSIKPLVVKADLKPADSAYMDKIINDLSIGKYSSLKALENTEAYQFFLAADRRIQDNSALMNTLFGSVLKLHDNKLEVKSSIDPKTKVSSKKTNLLIALKAMKEFQESTKSDIFYRAIGRQNGTYDITRDGENFQPLNNINMFDAPQVILSREPGISESQPKTSTETSKIKFKSKPKFDTKKYDFNSIHEDLETMSWNKSFDEINSVLKNILGEKTNFGLQIGNVNFSNSNTLGSFITALKSIDGSKDTILLNQYKGMFSEAVARHEAMHYISLRLLSSDQKSSLEKEVANILKSNGKEVTNTNIYEYIADSYMYKEKIPPMSVLGKFIAMIKAFVSKVLPMNLSLSELMYISDKGMFRDKTPYDIDSDTRMELYKQVDNTYTNLQHQEKFKKAMFDNDGVINDWKNKFIPRMWLERSPYTTNLDNLTLENGKIVSDIKQELLDNISITKDMKVGKDNKPISEIDNEDFTQLTVKEKYFAVLHNLTNEDVTNTLLQTAFPDLDVESVFKDPATEETGGTASTDFGENTKNDPDAHQSHIYNTLLSCIPRTDAEKAKEYDDPFFNPTTDFCSLDYVKIIMHNAVNNLRQDVTKMGRISTEDVIKEFKRMSEDYSKSELKNVALSLWMHFGDYFSHDEYQDSIDKTNIKDTYMGISYMLKNRERIAHQLSSELVDGKLNIDKESQEYQDALSILDKKEEALNNVLTKMLITNISQHPTICTRVEIKGKEIKVIPLTGKDIAKSKTSINDNIFNLHYDEDQMKSDSIDKIAGSKSYYVFTGSTIKDKEGNTLLQKNIKNPKRETSFMVYELLKEIGVPNVSVDFIDGFKSLSNISNITVDLMNSLFAGAYKTDMFNKYLELKATNSKGEESLNAYQQMMFDINEKYEEKDPNDPDNETDNNKKIDKEISSLRHSGGNKVVQEFEAFYKQHLKDNAETVGAFMDNIETLYQKNKYRQRQSIDIGSSKIYIYSPLDMGKNHLDVIANNITAVNIIAKNSMIRTPEGEWISENSRISQLTDKLLYGVYGDSNILKAKIEYEISKAKSSQPITITNGRKKFNVSIEGMISAIEKNMFKTGELTYDLLDNEIGLSTLKKSGNMGDMSINDFYTVLTAMLDHEIGRPGVTKLPVFFDNFSDKTKAPFVGLFNGDKGSILNVKRKYNNIIAMSIDPDYLVHSFDQASQWYKERQNKSIGILNTLVGTTDLSSITDEQKKILRKSSIAVENRDYIINKDGSYSTGHAAGLDSEESFYQKNFVDKYLSAKDNTTKLKLIEDVLREDKKAFGKLIADSGFKLPNNMIDVDNTRVVYDEEGNENNYEYVPLEDKEKKDKLNELIAHNYMIKDSNGNESLHPILNTLYEGFHMFNTQIQQVYKGDEYFYNGVTDFQKRAAGDISPIDLLDTKVKGGISETGRYIVVEDIPGYSKFLGPDSFEKDLKTNGYVINSPWKREQIINSYGGQLNNGIGSGGTIKTQLKDYDISKDQVTYFKQSEGVISQFLWNNDIYSRNLIKSMLTAITDHVTVLDENGVEEDVNLYNKFTTLIKDNGWKQGNKEFNKFLWTKDVNGKLVNDSVVGTIVHPSAFKSGTRGVNSYLESNGDYKIENNPTVIEVRNDAYGVQQIKKHPTKSWDKTMATQNLRMLSIGRHESNNTSDVNDVLKNILKVTLDKVEQATNDKVGKDVVMDMIRYIRDISKKNTFSDNRSLKIKELLSNENISLDVLKQEHIQNLLVDLNNVLKPNTLGGTYVQAPTQLKFKEENGIYKLFSELKGNDKTLDTSLKNTRFFTKDGNKYTELETKADYENAVSEGKNIRVRPADVVMEFHGRDEFGIPSNMTLSEVMTTKPRIITKDVLNMYDHWDNELTKSQRNMKISEFFNDTKDNDILKTFRPEIEKAITLRLKGSDRESIIDAITDYYHDLNKAMWVFTDRIPHSGYNSAQMGRIVAFAKGIENTILMSSEKNVFDGSDYDIDELHAYFYSTKQRESLNSLNTISHENDLFNITKNAYLDFNNIPLLTMTIDLKDMKSRVKKVNNYYANSLTTRTIKAIDGYAGRDLTGHMVNIQNSVAVLKSTMDNLVRSGVDQSIINKAIPESLQLLHDMSNGNTYTRKFINFNQALINAATDNNKLDGILGKLGINSGNTSLITGLLVMMNPNNNSVISDMITNGTFDLGDHALYIIGSPLLRKATEMYNNLNSISNDERPNYDVQIGKAYTSLRAEINDRYTFKLDSTDLSAQERKQLQIDKTNEFKSLKETKEEAIKAYYTGEQLRRFYSFDMLKTITPDEWTLYSTINNAEKNLGVSIKDFLANLDTYKKNGIEAENQWKYLVDNKTTNNNDQQRELSIRKALNIPLLIANNDLFVDYLRILDKHQEMISKSFTANNNESRNKVIDVQKFKDFNEDQFKGLQKESENNIIGNFIDMLPDVPVNIKDEETDKMVFHNYKMNNVNDRIRLLLDSDNIINTMKEKYAETNNMFTQQLNINRSKSGYPTIEIKNSKYYSNLLKNQLRSEFERLDDSDKNILRTISLVLYGFKTPNGSLSELIDTNNELLYSSKINLIKDKINDLDLVKEQAHNMIVRNYGLQNNFKGFWDTNTKTTNGDIITAHNYKGERDNNLFDVSNPDNPVQAVSRGYFAEPNTYSGDMKTFKGKMFKNFTSKQLKSADEINKGETISINPTKSRYVSLTKYSEDRSSLVPNIGDEVILENGVVGKIGYNKEKNMILFTKIGAYLEPDRVTNNIKTYSANVFNTKSTVVASDLIGTIVDKMKTMFPNIKIELVNNDNSFSKDKMGYVMNGKIYLNSDYVTSDTPLHEIGHIVSEVLKVSNRSLYESLRQNAIDILNSNEYLKKHINKNYSDLNREDQLSEVISLMIGWNTESKVSDMLTTIGDDKSSSKSIWFQIKDNVSNAIKSFVNSIATMLFGKPLQLKGISDYDTLTISKLSDILYDAFKNDKELSTIDSNTLQSIMDCNSDKLNSFKANIKLPTTLQEITPKLNKYDAVSTNLDNINDEQKAERIYEESLKDREGIVTINKQSYRVENAELQGKETVKDAKLRYIKETILPDISIDSTTFKTNLTTWLNTHKASMSKLGLFGVDVKKGDSTKSYEKFLRAINYDNKKQYLLFSQLKDHPELKHLYSESIKGFDPLVSIDKSTGQTVLSLYDVSPRLYNDPSITEKNQRSILRQYLTTTEERIRNITLTDKIQDVRQLYLQLMINEIGKKSDSIAVDHAMVIQLRKGAEGTKVFVIDPAQMNQAINEMKSTPKFMNELSPELQQLFKNDFVYGTTKYSDFVKYWYEQHKDVLTAEDAKSNDYIPQHAGRLFDPETDLSLKRDIISSRLNYLNRAYSYENMSQLHLNEVELLRNMYKELFAPKLKVGETNRRNLIGNIDQLLKITPNIGEPEFAFIRNQMIHGQDLAIQKIMEYKDILQGTLKQDGIIKTIQKEYFKRNDIENIKKWVVANEYKIYEDMYAKVKCTDGTDRPVGHILWTTDPKLDPLFAQQAKEKFGNDNNVFLQQGRKIKELVESQLISRIQHDYHQRTGYTIDEKKAKKRLETNSSYKPGMIPMMRQKSAESFYKNLNVFDSAKLATQEWLNNFSTFDSGYTDNKNTYGLVDEIHDMFLGQFEYSHDGRPKDLAVIDTEYGSNNRLINYLGLKASKDGKGKTLYSVDTSSGIADKISTNLQIAMLYFGMTGIRKKVYEEQVLPIANASMMMLKDMSDNKDVQVYKPENITKAIQLLARSVIEGKMSNVDEKTTSDILYNTANRIITPMMMVGNIRVPVVVTMTTTISALFNGLGSQFYQNGEPTAVELITGMKNVFTNFQKTLQWAYEYHIINTTELTNITSRWRGMVGEKYAFNNFVANWASFSTHNLSKLISMAAFMVKDGSWDAHTIDPKTGKGVYKIELDKKFQGKDGDILKEYHKKQMQLEEGINADGTFKRGYFSRESKAFKSYAERKLVGCFTPETRNLINMYTWGKWVGKFTQYLYSYFDAAFGKGEYLPEGSRVKVDKDLETGERYAHEEQLYFEGYYRSLFGYLSKMIVTRDLHAWSKLNNTQKANIVKAGTITAFTTAIALAIGNVLDKDQQKKLETDPGYVWMIARGVRQSVYASLVLPEIYKKMQHPSAILDLTGRNLELLYKMIYSKKQHAFDFNLDRFVWYGGKLVSASSIPYLLNSEENPFVDELKKRATK